MESKSGLVLCMGSACHQYGVAHVLPTLQRLLLENGLDDTIELKGAFCLGPCIHGIVLKFGDRLFTDLNAENVEYKFNEEILDALRSRQEG